MHLVIYQLCHLEPLTQLCQQSSFMYQSKWNQKQQILDVQSSWSSNILLQHRKHDVRISKYCPFRSMIYWASVHDISYKFLLLMMHFAKVFWWKIARCILYRFFWSNIFQTRNGTQIVPNEYLPIQHMQALVWNFWNYIHTVTSSSEPWIWGHNSGQTFAPQLFKSNNFVLPPPQIKY